MDISIWVRYCGLAMLCWISHPVNAAGEVTYLIADGAAEPYQIASVKPDQTAHSGILTDILFSALHESGTAITSIVRPYKRIKLEFLAQRHLHWIYYGSPSWLDERVLELGKYSEIPLLESSYSLIGLAASGTPTLGEIHAKKVIVIHGYSYYPSFYHWVAANDIQLIFAPSPRHALAMLKQKRGDFYMAESVRALWQARQSKVPLTELHMLDFSSIIPPSVVYFLFDKRIPAQTRQRIDRRLQELKESGELDSMIARYQ